MGLCMDKDFTLSSIVDPANSGLYLEQKDRNRTTENNSGGKETGLPEDII